MADDGALARLTLEQTRTALRLLSGGGQTPTNRARALRELEAVLRPAGAVQALLARAPAGAREAFARVAHGGGAPVERLLGRGWWGHGTLPPPLDWLQQRALVVLGDDGLVHASDAARASWGAAPPDPGGAAVAGVTVRPAGCVVVAADPAGLDRALTVAHAGLTVVAPTVAVSRAPAGQVAAALRDAGVTLDAARTDPFQPALPGTAEAVGPRAVRELLGRAVASGRQVRLHYFASSRGGAATDRVVDPWSLRDDLLVGWCHLRTDERTFAVDRIGRAQLLVTPIEHGAT